MELDRDFSEFIESCARNSVRFLIVGGYAVAAHGHPRFTASGRPQDVADVAVLKERAG